MGAVTQEKENPTRVRGHAPGKPHTGRLGRWVAALHVRKGESGSLHVLTVADVRFTVCLLRGKAVGPVKVEKLRPEAARQLRVNARLDFIGVVARALAVTYEAEHLRGR